MRLTMALTAGTLGTLALLLVGTPWSDSAALPVSFMLLLPSGILLAGIVELVWQRPERIWQRPKPLSPGARWWGRIAAAVIGGAILFGAATISNLAFVDEPVEGNTLVGYAVSAALGLGSTVLLGRSKTFRKVCVSVDPARALIVVPILLGIARAVMDVLAFRWSSKTISVALLQMGRSGGYCPYLLRPRVTGTTTTEALDHVRLRVALVLFPFEDLALRAARRGAAAGAARSARRPPRAESKLSFRRRCLAAFRRKTRA